MTRVAPAMAPPAIAPPAQGPPGRGSGDFAPVLRSEGSRARPETSETSARTARAEGTTPRADDPGASKAEAAQRRPADAPRDDRPSDEDAAEHDTNGVGPEVSAAAHRAHDEGTSVSESVHAALRAIRGEGEQPVPADAGDPAETEATGTPVPAVDVVPAPAVPNLAAGDLSATGPAAAAEQVPAELLASADVPASTVPSAAQAVVDAAAAAQATAVPVTPGTEPVPAPTSAVETGPVAPAAPAAAPVAVEADPAAGSTSADVPAADTTPTAPAQQGPAAGTTGDGASDADAGDGARAGLPHQGKAEGHAAHAAERGRGHALEQSGATTGEPVTDRVEESGSQPAPATAPQRPAHEGGPAATQAQAAPAGAVADQVTSRPIDERVPVTKTETPLRAGSRLAELAETFRTVVRVAAQEGRTEARITLHPGDLGEVQIRLRYEQGGVSADVLADSRQAAQTLQQSVSDLRRSLESQGLNVLWLDVRHGGQERPAWLSAQGGAGGGSTQSSDLEDELVEREIPVERLDSSGAILDVLA